MDSSITMPDDDQMSLFGRKFKIPSIKSDPLRWNKEWDKVLHTLTSKDVYLILSPMWEKRGDLDTSELANQLKDQVLKIQEMMVGIWNDLEEKGHFESMWLLLEEGEHKRHLLKGMQEACEHAPWSQDSRALCPEVTFSFMLKQRGKAFIDFLNDFNQGKTAAGVGAIYSIPSEWWGKAVDTSEPLSEEVEFTFALLTLQRNEFIAQFLLRTVMSVLYDISYGSPGMDPVIDIMKSDASFARIWGKTLSGMRDKPVIRCQNCTKSPEEIGGGPKFMLCSSCKTKLDFAVYYCSQACQKEDWRAHKKHCGKQKVSKKLRGTAQDPFWAFPDCPDHLRNVSSHNGQVPVNSIGFGTPHPSRPHSPALQRQVSLCTADRDVDYFLFDELQCPVRFVIHDTLTKMTFRMLRSDAMFSEGQDGLGGLAEYLIKTMGQKSGLSREIILTQLSSEYGGDISSRVTKFESMAVANGYEPGSTFVEVLSRGFHTTLPHIMNKKM